ncbi:MAG: hypothetical protein ACK578_28810, partial [Pirellula sp.]
RYHVVHQRGTIAETSREMMSSHITTLLANVGCWSGSVRWPTIAPRWRAAWWRHSIRTRCLVTAMALR